MKRIFTMFMMLLALLLAAVPMMAETDVFLPGNPSVGSSINSDGFFVRGDTFGLFGAHAYAYDFHLDAFGPTYSDAGLVIGLDGKTKLGTISNVSVDSTGAPLGINFWFDTGGDGKLFSLDPISGLLLGLNGDSYSSCGPPTINAASSCYMQGGAGAGGTYTLSALQSGTVAGINSDTPAALWIGITNPGGQSLSADISSITLTTTSAVPEPGTIYLFCTMLAGVFFVCRRHIRNAQS